MSTDLLGTEIDNEVLYIAGGVAGVVLFVVLVCIICCCCCSSKEEELSDDLNNQRIASSNTNVAGKPVVSESQHGSNHVDGGVTSVFTAPDEGETIARPKSSYMKRVEESRESIKSIFRPSSQYIKRSLKKKKKDNVVVEEEDGEEIKISTKDLDI